METNCERWYEQIDPYVGAFFKALRLRNFDEADLIVSQLKIQATQLTEYTFWPDYFAGILAEERDRNWAKAENQYLELLSMEIEPVLRAHILLSLGVAYHNQSRWTDSIHACKQSASIWRDLGYQIKPAYVSRQIAFSLQTGYRFGEFGPEVLEQATLICQNALKAFESYDPTKPEIVLYEPDVQQYEAMTLFVLGNILGDAGEWEQATFYYERYLQKSIQLSDQYLKAFALRELGGAYQMSNLRHWSEIRDMYDDALTIFQEVKDPLKEFSVLANKECSTNQSMSQLEHWNITKNRLILLNKCDKASHQNQREWVFLQRSHIFMTMRYCLHCRLTM